jgi:hypothetical protein
MGRRGRRLSPSHGGRDPRQGPGEEPRTLLPQVEAARAGLEKALAALKGLNPADYPPYMLPKLLEASAIGPSTTATKAEAPD